MIYIYILYYLLFVIQAPIVYVSTQIAEFLSRHAESGANLDNLDEIE